MQGIEGVSLITAFSAGLLSFFSPCVLPLIPVYLSFVSGLSFEQMTESANRKKTILTVFFNTLLFVLGFSVVFVLLGFGASTVGQFLKVYQRQVAMVAGLVILILSLHFMGLLRIKALYYEKRHHMQKRRFGPASSFFLGLFFAFGWTPCIGPILTAILAIASQQETASAGVILLAVYSAGMAIPFLVTAIFLNTFLGLFKKVNRFFDVIETALGGVLMVAAVWMIFSQMTHVLPSIYPTSVAAGGVLVLLILKKKASVKIFNLVTAVLVVAIIGAGVGLYIFAPPPDVQAGQGPLNIGYDDFEQNPVDLLKYKGKPVLLNFFASWCDPCKKEIPELIKIHEEKAQGRFTIIGINCDEDPKDGLALVESLKIPYPVVHGSVQHLQTLGERTALPTNMILDGAGNKFKTFTGFPGEEILLTQIEALAKNGETAP